MNRGGGRGNDVADGGEVGIGTDDDGHVGLEHAPAGRREGTVR